MKKGYYNETTIAKFADALKNAKKLVRAILESGIVPQVKFSGGNTKMGLVPSVSTMPFFTCPHVCSTTCGVSCYAAKLANLRKNVLNSYAWNTAVVMLCPEEYHAQVKAFCRGQRYFRYHVSGDIVNKDYFAHMVENALENPHCEILAFTKRFEIVNDWISANGALPENLHILFSGWNNLKPENPHGLPETTVFEHDSEFCDNWKTCGGNCFNCACRGLGCWNAKSGDIVAFKKH